MLSFDLNADDSITLKTKLRCYDSANPDTDDYDEGNLDPFTLPAGGTLNLGIYVDGENYSEASFTVRNETNQS